MKATYLSAVAVLALSLATSLNAKIGTDVAGQGDASTNIAYIVSDSDGILPSRRAPALPTPSVLLEVDGYHVGHCSICDEHSDYACSPYGAHEGWGWPDAVGFSDPVPPDMLVTQIIATVNGVNCHSEFGGLESAAITVRVNGWLVGLTQQYGDCACDTCQPAVTTSAIYADGFPGYAYGQTNDLVLQVDGVSCISNVILELFYELSDVDGDGLAGAQDNCPFVPNPDQADTDADTVGDVCDNCIATPNSQQGDGDQNGVGDCCESDQPDCNANGFPDRCDLSEAISQDCNGNNLPDECDVASGGSTDCDQNQIPDECEADCNGNGITDACDLAAGSSQDCTDNGIPDECDIATGLSADCQPNAIPDGCDIADGVSQDCNANGRPDECEPDCNGNSVADGCDIAAGFSQDCNGNGIPDQCDIHGAESNDCNVNGVPDECEPDCNWTGLPDDCDIAIHISYDCDLNGIPDECETDCNGNGLADSCDIADALSQDCDSNGIPDECEQDCNGNGVEDSCDIADGTSHDCDSDGIPDDCYLPWNDCNQNAVLDNCDIADGISTDCQADGIPDDCQLGGGFFGGADCNANAVPDDCDIVGGASADCQPNGIPDECESDCNANAVEDSCDIASGASLDCNRNLIPDECDVSSALSADCNTNGVPDECEPDCNANDVADGCDLAAGASQDCDSNGVPDECSRDCNGNGVPDGCDLAAGTSPDCHSDGIPDECQFVPTLATAQGKAFCANAQLIQPGIVYAGTTVGATTDGISVCDFFDSYFDNVDVWYSYRPKETGTLTLSTCDSPSYASISVYSDCPGNLFNEIACSNLFFPCGTGGFGTYVSLPVTAGTEYMIRVFGYGEGSYGESYLGEYLLTLSGPDLMPPSRDCNGNGVLDECDIAQGASRDCAPNGVPDECEPDCNANAVEDSCDIASGMSLDCNHNSIPDECDISASASDDCNTNDVPDECEPDCNENSRADSCDIAAGTSHDCQPDGIPDECQLAENPAASQGQNSCSDAQLVGPGISYAGSTVGATTDGMSLCDLAGFDNVDLWYSYRPMEDGTLTVSTCDSASHAMLSVYSGCPGSPVNEITCSIFSCGGYGAYVSLSVTAGTEYMIRVFGFGEGEYGDSYLGDYVLTLSGPEVLATSHDCNDNRVPDECDLAHGASRDCTGNGIPDECEADCNGNGAADSCDIDLGFDLDCNANGVPDRCDIAAGSSQDCNSNEVPDDCEWRALLGGQGRAERSVAGGVFSEVCQFPDRQVHGGAFFSPADDGGVPRRMADGFTFPDATVITGLRWWGLYRDLCGEPCQASDDFVVAFYVNESGPASTLVRAFPLGEVTRFPTGLTIPLDAGFDEYQYEALLDPPLSLDAGRRYWVEIRNTSSAECVWRWETAPQGATGNSAAIYDAAGDGFAETDLVPFDLAFCVTGLPTAQDCNRNGLLDAQEIAVGASQDCQPNGIPDECEEDRNYNAVPDICDIVVGSSKDQNFNGWPDETDCLTTPGDMDGDCDVERNDYSLFAACLGKAGADLIGGCACADFDLSGAVDFDDYLAFSVAAGQPVLGCRVTPPDACPDSWTTGAARGGVAGALGASESFYDFGLHGPIPAGFFADGSDAFGDVVTFIGTPADPSGVHGSIDTQIQHGPVIFDPSTGTATTALDIVTLNLISRDPITVTYNGGQNAEQWLVVVGLSPHDPGQGQLAATLHSPDANAGTYDATVYVQPAFLFVRLQDLVDHLLPECVAVRILDTGEPAGQFATAANHAGRTDGNAGRNTTPPGAARGLQRASEPLASGSASAALPPITLSFTGQPFVRMAAPAIVEQMQVPGCAQGNFVPGVIEFGGRGGVAGSGQQLTCSGHITEGEAHYFCPPECRTEDVCQYARNGSPTPFFCNSVPSFPSSTLGAECAAASCSPERVTFKTCPGGGFAVQTYGSPSCVTRESTCKGACCTNHGECVLGSAGLCDGTYMGDGTTCGSITCPTPNGACCRADGTCEEQPQSACKGPNDSYEGDGTRCDTAACLCVADILSLSPRAPCVDVGGSLSPSDFDIVTDPGGFESSVEIAPATFTIPGPNVPVTGTLCDSTANTTITVVNNEKFDELPWSDIQALVDSLDLGLEAIEYVANAGGAAVCTFDFQGPTGDVSLFRRERCCQDGVQTHNGATGSISMEASLDCTPPGIGFRWGDLFEAGVTLGAALNGDASLTLKEDCEQPLSACLEASLTGTLSAQVGVEVVLADDLANFTVTGTASASAGVNGGCCLNQAGSATATLDPLSVEGTVDVYVLGFWHYEQHWGPQALLAPISSDPIAFDCTLPDF